MARAIHGPEKTKRQGRKAMIGLTIAIGFGALAILVKLREAKNAPRPVPVKARRRPLRD
jgi:hypothetical protein